MKQSRRGFLSVFAGGLLLWGIAGCDSGTSSNPSDTSEGTTAEKTTSATTASSSPTGSEMTIAVIPKGLTHVFWQSCKAGAEKAGAEFGVKIRWDGPQKESDTAGQIAVVENAITAKVDGIVLAPLDKAALVGVIKKAKEANIPLTIFDSGADTEEYVSFVATDNRKGGEMAAVRMGELLAGKGKVAIIPVFPNSASTGEREDGFEETIKAKFPDITVVRSNYGNSDRAQSLKVTEDVLAANPDIVGIFGPNESSIVGALQACKNRNLIGKVKLVGFDSTKQLVEALEKGDIDSLVVQNPFKMGYEGVKTIVDLKQGKTPEKSIDTGVVLATKENRSNPEVAELLK
jgi:ribose transport system substrate-binding protein